MDPIDMEIGARLRALRERRMLPLASLAQLIKVTPGELKRYETGEIPVPVSVVVRIARALEASAADLIGEGGEPSGAG